MAVKPGNRLRRYSIQEKRAACTCFLITGSIAKTALETGISKRTLHMWMKTAWWASWEEQITEEIGKRLVSKMRGVADEAYEQLAERLAEGDVQVMSNGDVVRHPIKAKDLSIIGNIASDKIRLYEGKPTSRSESVSLDASAKLFEQLAAKYGDKIEQMGGERPIIEGEIVKPALPGDKS